MAVVGPVNMTRMLRTERDDRVTNMWAFAEPALALFVECLESSDRHDVELHERPDRRRFSSAHHSLRPDAQDVPIESDWLIPVVRTKKP
jgi:hypothetical protein